jgi:hypothetical protein
MDYVGSQAGLPLLEDQLFLFPTPKPLPEKIDAINIAAFLLL